MAQRMQGVVHGRAGGQYAAQPQRYDQRPAQISEALAAQLTSVKNRLAATTCK